MKKAMVVVTIRTSTGINFFKKLLFLIDVKELKHLKNILNEFPCLHDELFFILCNKNALFVMFSYLQLQL